MPEHEITPPKPLKFGKMGLVCPHCGKELGITVRVFGAGGGGSRCEGGSAHVNSQDIPGSSGSGPAGGVEVVTWKF